MNEEQRKFRERIIKSMRTDCEFNTSCLTSDKSIKDMEERMSRSIEESEIKLAEGRQKLNNQNCRVGDGESLRYSMDLKNFIITNAKAAGLDDAHIAGLLQSAMRKLPGNVPEEKWEEQVMEWINIRAKKNNSLNVNNKEQKDFTR